jgi:hypothetical protein
MIPISQLRVELPAKDDIETRDRSGSYAPLARPNSPTLSLWMFNLYPTYPQVNPHLLAYDAPYIEAEEHLQEPLHDTLFGPNMGIGMTRSVNSSYFEDVENLHDPIKGGEVWRAMPGDAFLIERLTDDLLGGIVWEYYTIYTLRKRWRRLTVCYKEGTPSPFQYKYFNRH